MDLVVWDVSTDLVFLGCFGRSVVIGVVRAWAVFNINTFI